MAHAQVGTLHTSVVRLQLCKGNSAPRKGYSSSRQPLTVRSAASTASKQAVQADQVELGKTGLHRLCTSATVHKCVRTIASLIEMHHFPMRSLCPQVLK